MCGSGGVERGDSGVEPVTLDVIAETAQESIPAVEGSTVEAGTGGDKAMASKCVECSASFSMIF